MKKEMLMVIWLALLFAGVAGPVRAQGFFSQNKTYLKRTGEQIALLYSYIQFLEKGYAIAEDGLHLINDIKHGDFNIHSSYFNSLTAINPSIKGYSKVDEITSWYNQISLLYDRSTKIARDPLFAVSERKYIGQVWEQHLSDANIELQELKLLTSPGNYALKDDERIKRIERIWTSMRDRYAFARDFANTVSVMLVQKKKEQADVIGTAKMTGINE